jgi:hypothetical protein
VRKVHHHGWVESSHHFSVDPDIWEASGFVVQEHSQVVFGAPVTAVRAARISGKAAQKPFPQLLRTHEKSPQSAAVTPAHDDSAVEMEESRVIALALPLIIENVPAEPQVLVILDQHVTPTMEAGGCDAALEHMAAKSETRYC